MLICLNYTKKRVFINLCNRIKRKTISKLDILAKLNDLTHIIIKLQFFLLNLVYLLL